MHPFHILSRRSFLTQSFKTGMAIALSTLVDIPGVMKRALAQGGLGQNGKKLLFIFLRGANDGLNSVIPIGDSAYGPSIRPSLALPADSAPGLYTTPGGCFDATQYADAGGTARTASLETYSYAYAIPTGNGFAALHPSLKFLAPVYNAGHLALIHRVGYPRQSRSHFDSQNYWENGAPNNNLVRDGILYRAMLESGLAHTHPLTGVSINSSLPLILRGSAAAMTNIPNVGRYGIVGLPGQTGRAKSESALAQANENPFVDKKNRELLMLHYGNLMDTLPLFQEIASQLDRDIRDDVATDNDQPYSLFPLNNTTNGGYARPDGTTDPNKYVVDTAAYDFFKNLKAAALVLNKTDAVVAGTEFGGFDTHNSQGQLTGAHPNRMRRIGWALYALRKYFSNEADRVNWNNLVVVTLSEFGRTTVENSNLGTDHAEASVMWLAGGAVRGHNGTDRSGVLGCHPNDPVPWVIGPANQAGDVDGSMFGVQNRYLKRAIDYRSVLGEIIRDHLGATPAQLNRIIPGYADAGERLQTGGVSAIDGTPIQGEVGIL